MSGAHVAVGLVAVAWLAGTAGLCVAFKAAGRNQGYAERDAELDERFGWAPEVVHEPEPLREPAAAPQVVMVRVQPRVELPGAQDEAEAWLRSVGWGGAA